MGKLDGQIAVVTGAARGIGRAFALRLARLGAAVAVCDVDLRSFAEFETDRRDGPNRTTVDLIAEGGGIAIGYEFDVRSADAVADAFATVRERLGPVDILVCNAGGGRGSPNETRAASTDPDLWRQVFDLNLLGAVHCVNNAAPDMVARGAGRIVTVSSSTGLIPTIDGGYAHYGSTKAAIIQYTKFLARDLGPRGIAANCIAPGTIATGRVLEKVIPNSSRANTDLTERVGLRRLGTPEDCAGVLEFLVTDLSGYVNGVVIPVDGGLIR